MPIEFKPASTSTGVKIDIILGKDKRDYFAFAKPVNYYLNDISPKEDTTSSETDNKKNTQKKSEKKPSTTPIKTSKKTSSQKKTTNQGTSKPKIQPKPSLS